MEVQVASMCLTLSFELFSCAPSIMGAVFHSDLTYSNVTMKLSHRSTDPVCLVRSLDLCRNAPISNNHLISLWVTEDPCTLRYAVQCIFNVYLEQAGMTYDFCQSCSLKQISFSLFKYEALTAIC